MFKVKVNLGLMPPVALVGIYNSKIVFAEKIICQEGKSEVAS